MVQRKTAVRSNTERRCVSLPPALIKKIQGMVVVGEIASFSAACYNALEQWVDRKESRSGMKS